MTLQSQETKFEKKTNQNKFHCVAADVDLGRLPPFLLGENSKEKKNPIKKKNQNAQNVYRGCEQGIR